jgi:hypothetical protein
MVARCVFGVCFVVSSVERRLLETRRLPDFPAMVGPCNIFGRTSGLFEAFRFPADEIFFYFRSTNFLRFKETIESRDVSVASSRPRLVRYEYGMVRYLQLYEMYDDARWKEREQQSSSYYNSPYNRSLLSYHPSPASLRAVKEDKRPDQYQSCHVGQQYGKARGQSTDAVRLRKFVRTPSKFVRTPYLSTMPVSLSCRRRIHPAAVATAATAT